MAAGDWATDVVLATDRLVLRPWRAAEADVLRELWTERDPRVPEHRRIDALGRPTRADLARRIVARPSPTAGLLAIERRAVGDVVGYCGLVDGPPARDLEPQLAFELLRRAWGQGYATEAASAVLAWARSSGHQRLWATVWDWNAASRRVLHKLGFVERTAGEIDVGAVEATPARSIVATRLL